MNATVEARKMRNGIIMPFLYRLLTCCVSHDQTYQFTPYSEICTSIIKTREKVEIEKDSAEISVRAKFVG
jgi:hypothetical protein